MCPCHIQCTVIRSNGSVERDCTTDGNAFSSSKSRYAVIIYSNTRNSCTCVIFNVRGLTKILNLHTFYSDGDILFTRRVKF